MTAASAELYIVPKNVDTYQLSVFSTLFEMSINIQVIHVIK